MIKPGLPYPRCACDLCHDDDYDAPPAAASRISHDFVICDAARCVDWAQNAMRRLNELTPYRNVKMPEVITVLGLETCVTPAAA